MQTFHLISGVVLQVGRGKKIQGSHVSKPVRHIHVSSSYNGRHDEPRNEYFTENSDSSVLDRTEIAILGLPQNNARLSVKWPLVARSVITRRGATLRGAPPLRTARLLE
jgi:hypothetical protein